MAFQSGEYLFHGQTQSQHLTPSRGCSPPQAKTSVNGCGFEARVVSLRESTLLKAVIKADKETLTDAV
ncbi:hypothetical protein SNOG_01490 [Parastagonospora nodorum SN15]|uniref:Uncharacterized protein n=1 Tax=Phaeosphaeria nodorum (strain SN15 / ATCC MYA-4574 / FGSC 10173) TaxID=321614 RepID=Q0V3C4_PHANO|nr:hypothetical protein SNOG_01490 [Parastagonospora nodorum SN15]EAT91139.1 hypothetical protein SNOG_01490 [Parastagonospora nodorum SN15]